MGFRFRRSINLGGGFKINLSKSGIGYSWGTKGYRISRTARGTTPYSIPGTGLSYIDESGSHSRNRNRSQRHNQNRITQSTQRQIPQPTYNQPPERAIESADISQFKEAEEGTVSDALERTIRLNFIGTILLWGLLLIPVNPILVFIPVVGVFLKIAAHSRQGHS